MSAKIYRPPTDIKVPESPFTSKDWRVEEKRYIDEVRAFCMEHGKGKLRGEEISIPHADSAAYYMVLSTRPLQLLTLEIGDSWHSPHADLLTAKRVTEMVEGEKRMAKLFPPKAW